MKNMDMGYWIYHPQWNKVKLSSRDWNCFKYILRIGSMSMRMVPRWIDKTTIEDRKKKMRRIRYYPRLRI